MERRGPSNLAGELPRIGKEQTEPKGVISSSLKASLLSLLPLSSVHHSVKPSLDTRRAPTLDHFQQVHGVFSLLIPQPRHLCFSPKSFQRLVKPTDANLIKTWLTMKFFVLMRFLTAAAITAVADNFNATALRGLPLTFALAPNATELLQTHGLWAPDPAAFAAGKPNVNATMNLTTEAEKLRASGLDANDLVRIDIDTAATIGLFLGGEVSNDCRQCDSCQEGCFGLVLFLPAYGM